MASENKEIQGQARPVLASKTPITTPRWFFSPTVAGLDTESFLTLANEALATRRNWGMISGGYQQFDLFRIRDGLVRQSDLTRAALALLDKHGCVPSETRKAMVPKHFKLLLAEPGSGPQAPHRDGLSTTHWVVALFLTKNRSTEIARHGDSDWSGQDMQSWPTAPGSMLIFREDTIHRGIKNEASEDRAVIFMVLGPEEEEHNDDYQHYEWSEAATKHGWDSDEFCAAMKRNEHHNPMPHYSIKQQKLILPILKRYEAKQQEATGPSSSAAKPKTPSVSARIKRNKQIKQERRNHNKKRRHSGSGGMPESSMNKMAGRADGG